MYLHIKIYVESRIFYLDLYYYVKWFAFTNRPVTIWCWCWRWFSFWFILYEIFTFKSNSICHISTFSGVFGAPQLIPRAVPLWRIALWKVPFDNGERSWNIAALASFWLHVDEESWQERHLQRDTAAASRLSEDGHLTKRKRLEQKNVISSPC